MQGVRAVNHLPAEPKPNIPSRNESGEWFHLLCSRVLGGCGHLPDSLIPEQKAQIFESRDGGTIPVPVFSILILH
jgi:hypothetical protein